MKIRSGTKKKIFKKKLFKIRSRPLYQRSLHDRQTAVRGERLRSVLHAERVHGARLQHLRLPGDARPGHAEELLGVAAIPARHHVRLCHPHPGRKQPPQHDPVHAAHKPLQREDLHLHLVLAVPGGRAQRLHLPHLAVHVHQLVAQVLHQTLPQGERPPRLRVASPPRLHNELLVAPNRRQDPGRVCVRVPEARRRVPPAHCEEEHQRHCSRRAGVRALGSLQEVSAIRHSDPRGREARGREAHQRWNQPSQR